MTILMQSNTYTTTTYQNVAGGDGPTGFFFTGSWDNPGVELNMVNPGWIINNDPNWVVVSTDPSLQTITNNGYADFVSGVSYYFIGFQSGMSVLGGITFSN
jgi:hypothetical protein